MARKFLIDGNWLICSEGTCMQRMLVKSQKTVFAHGKLVATMNDRMDNNFYCLKMVSAGAMVGAIVGAAIAAGAIFTGGAAIGGIMAAVGTSALTGSISGKLLSLMPCICACLTKPGKWTSVKNSVLIQNQMALMPDAKLNCLLGGMVSIVLPSIQLAIDCLLISDYCYKKKDSNAELPEGWKETTEDINIEKERWENESGFKASLYYNEKEKLYILAFAGTEDLKDWITDIRQGVGLDDGKKGQYHKAAELADKVQEYTGQKNLIITGHSLGGGLASIASAVTGSKAYTFNAAGLHSKTLKDQKLSENSMGHIQAYYSTDDPLNMIQNNRSILGSLLASSGNAFLAYLGSGLILGDNLPQVAGEKIGLETNSNIIDGHFLKESNLLKTLKDEKENNPDLLVFTSDF
jgi:hypothetical protein